MTVLRGISFSVDEGRIVAILGPNGAGKTTTLRALSGMVRRAGRDQLRRRGRHGLEPGGDRAARIAHVPEGRGTFTGLTVEENLRVGAYPRRDRGGIAEDIERCFEYFPRLRRAPRRSRRQPERRRAADARDRARR